VAARVAATHNGPFHADDVLAWSLLCVFYPEPLELKRTRSAELIAAADIAFDVGGLYDPATGRFDHHQADYRGPRSSAGLILDWLEGTGHVPAGLATALRDALVNYVDAVDTGARSPTAGVPCFATLVDVLNAPASALGDFDVAFVQAALMGQALLRGLAASQQATALAEAAVLDAMALAVATGSRVIYLDDYYAWKPIYFAHDGVTHPTDFVLFPGHDSSWRLVAIPPELGDFGQKQPLPRAWAGLSDAELERVTGIPGAVFCHKNRFIAVFATREAADQAIELLKYA